MIRHLVLMKWKEGVSAESIAAVTNGLRDLPAIISQIKSYTFGPDLSIYKGNFDYALVADFENQDDFKAYVVHESHKGFLKNITAPILDSFHSLQFEVK